MKEDPTPQQHSHPHPAPHVDRDRWWATFNAALTGILANPSTHHFEEESSRAAARAIATAIHGAL